MSGPLRILLVDDDGEDHLITLTHLRRAFGAGVTLDWARSWDDALEAIRAGGHDVYLVDYGLGGHNGIELLRETAAVGTMAPVIMLTGADDREIDLAAQAAGASDYLVKRDLSAPLLERAIRYAIERKKVERRLVTLAHCDPLTGLVNRARFRTQLEADIRYGRRSETSLAVLLLDLDHFKDVNDTLGHPAGDALLRQVATRLESVVRETDTVARLGGDEFAIIANHLHDVRAARVLAEKILASLAEPVVVEGHELFITTSIGITLCPEDGCDPDNVLRNADLALYKAKGEGREHFQFYSARLNARAQARKCIEAEIRAALGQSAFCLHYQPRIDLHGGRIVGVEALVRWLRADGSWTMPDDFVPAAEASGLIVPLGEWVFREACQQKVSWDRCGVASGPIAVNVSAVQLRRDEFFNRLVRMLDETGVDPAGIQVEMTESALMNPDDASARRLGLLRERGLRLAIDDFGTGYSSLSRLKRLPVDTLKIDRSFVRGIETDRDDAAIVQAVINLGASLDLTVVAEGVETRAQVDFLRLRGCREAQGLFYSKALDPDALVAWVHACEPRYGTAGA